MWSGIPDLLKTWRVDVKKFSLRQAAQLCQQFGQDQQVRISHTKLAHWETKGARLNHIPDYGLQILDATYRAKGALVGIARSLSSPAALKPRWNWAHSFQPYVSGLKNSIPVETGPVWTWLRPGKESPFWIEAEVSWGIFSVKISQSCGQEGLFLTCPVSTSHPALFVKWKNEPGWADFGHGEIPPGLGVQTISVLGNFQILNATLVIKNMWNYYFDKNSVLPIQALLNKIQSFFFSKPGFLPKLFNRDVPQETKQNLIEFDSIANTDKETSFSPHQFQALRQHRGLSRQEVAKEVNLLLKTTSVSKDQIGHLEEGRNTTSKFLVSCLDMVYGIGGYSFRQEVSIDYQGDQTAIVKFPSHWIGPVSVKFESNQFEPNIEPIGTAGLSWREWKTSFSLHSGTRVAFRKDIPDPTPLFVHFPKSWKITAEMGHCQDAVSVNKNWTFEDRPEIRQTLLDRLVPIGVGLGAIE